MSGRWRAERLLAVLLAVLSAVLLVVATSCAGSHGRWVSSGRVLPLPAPSGPVGLADPALINLQRGDFPAAWISTPPTSPGSATPTPGSADPETVAIYACLHLPIAAREQLSDVDSATFQSGQTFEAASNVTVLSSAAVVAQEVAALQTDAGINCLGQAIGQSVAAGGAGVTNAKINMISAPTIPGGAALGVHYAATFTQGEQSIDASTDEYFIGLGAAEITVTFSSFEVPFPATVQQTALAHLVARL